MNLPNDKTDITLFEKLYQELEALSEVLNEEKNALEKRDIALLEELTKKKTSLCSSLAILEEQRRQLQSDALSEVQTKNLRDLFSRIHEMNQLNGIIVTNQLQHSQAAMSILSGRKNSDDKTYDESGVSNSSSQAGWVVSTWAKNLSLQDPRS